MLQRGEYQVLITDIQDGRETLPVLDVPHLVLFLKKRHVRANKVFDVADFLSALAYPRHSNLPNSTSCVHSVTSLNTAEG